MPSLACTTRAMSEAAWPIFSIAAAIDRTSPICSASSGERAASIEICRSFRRYQSICSSRTSTSSARSSSLKKTAA